MARKKNQPVEGAAVSESTVNVQVNEQIKQMSGFQNETELVDALPDTTTGTADPSDDKPRRKRRSKEEMARARGESTGEPIGDPLMNDKRYQKAIQNMNSDTGTGFVKSGFKVAAMAKGDQSWELQPEEAEKSDDFFYVLSKKYGWFDPTGSPITMAIYFVAMLGMFVSTRVMKGKGDDMYKQLSRWFGFGEAEKGDDAAATT